MFIFIVMLIVSMLFLMTSIILGIKTYKTKKRNREITSEDDERKRENRLMIMTVISLIFTAFTSFYALFNSVPPPTIYPLNNEARVYDGSADVIIESYPIFSIYYSLDGSDPKNGKIYKDSFTITETTTVVAKNRFLHFFWSKEDKNTYRFENMQTMTVNSVDNNSDDHIAEIFAYVILFFIFGTMFFNAVRGR